MRTVGWVLFTATCVLFVMQGVFLAASDLSLLSYDVLVDQVFPLLGIGAIVGAGVGALIVSRYPRNPVGWLFLVGQLGNVIGLAAEAFNVLVAQGVVESSSAAVVSGYLSDVFGTVFTVNAMSIIFMIAPDGRILSPRWRPAVGVPIVSQLFWWAGAFTRSPEVYVPQAASEPQGMRETLTQEWFTYAGFLAMLLAITLGAIALVLRLRRSTGQQRLQLRWISTGAAALAVAFVLFALSDVLPWGTPWILPVATCLAYIFLSVSVGVAIFRYRLYDIDLILSRAIVLAVVAMFVTVGYIAVVVAIGYVLTAFGEPGSSLYWPSLVATAVVAVAFQMLRRNVLRLADQLVYGRRAAPYEALATFSRQLAASPSPDALPARVAEATGRAVGAATVTARLGKPGDPAQLRSASWSEKTGSEKTGSDQAGSARPVGSSLVLPVVDMAEQVGSIEVTMPPGRPTRTFERHLLQDVAAQAGVAFRNALLEAELARQVAQSEHQATELAASRQRLLDVEDEARERLAGAIRHRVVPHLATVGTDLANIRGTAGSASDLESLIDETQLALDELRAVCRGVFPALLDRRGLVAALTAQLTLTHPHAALLVDATADQRLNRAVEAAGYLFCIEVTPTDRHSQVVLRVLNGTLIATIAGDPEWGIDEPSAVRSDGAWQHCRDRLAALDGRLVVRREEDGMTVSAFLPLH